MRFGVKGQDGIPLALHLQDEMPGRNDVATSEEEEER